MGNFARNIGKLIYCIVKFLIKDGNFFLVLPVYANFKYGNFHKTVYNFYITFSQCNSSKIYLVNSLKYTNILNNIFYNL